jgi:hypothetical protein
VRGRRAGWILGTLVGLAVLAAALVACGDDDTQSAPQLSDPDATGQQLADQFLTLLHDKDVDGLQDFLSDAFIIQRADGSFAAKDDYLTKLPEIGLYEIRDVTAKQSGDALTVKWELVVDEVINGSTFSGDPAPRLSTFSWDPGTGRWRMTGHANFNVLASPTPAAGS